jgi:hypothetical protein
MSGLASQEINVLYLTPGGILSSIEKSKISNGMWIQETGKEYEGTVNMLTPDSRVSYF